MKKMLNAFLMIVGFSCAPLKSFELRDLPLRLRIFASKILPSKSQASTKEAYIVLDSKSLTNENSKFQEAASLIAELSHLQVRESTFHAGLGFYTIRFRRPTALAALQGLKNIEPAIKEIRSDLNLQELFYDRLQRGSEIKTNSLSD